MRVFFLSATTYLEKFIHNCTARNTNNDILLQNFILNALEWSNFLDLKEIVLKFVLRLYNMYIGFNINSAIYWYCDFRDKEKIFTFERF